MQEQGAQGVPLKRKDLKNKVAFNTQGDLPIRSPELSNRHMSFSWPLGPPVLWNRSLGEGGGGVGTWHPTFPTCPSIYFSKNGPSLVHGTSPLGRDHRCIMNIHFIHSGPLLEAEVLHLCWVESLDNRNWRHVTMTTCVEWQVYFEDHVFYYLVLLGCVSHLSPKMVYHEWATRWRYLVGKRY